MILYQLFGGSCWLLLAAIICFVLQKIKKFNLAGVAGGCVALATGHALLMHAGAYDSNPFFTGGLFGELLYHGVTLCVPLGSAPLVAGLLAWLLVTCGVLLIGGYRGLEIIARLRLSPSIQPAATSSLRARLRRTGWGERGEAAMSGAPVESAGQKSPTQTQDQFYEELLAATKPQVSPEVMHDHEERAYPFPALEQHETDNKQTDKNAHHAQRNIKILEEKLARFGIRGSVTSVTVGPVVTLYEYQPHIDTKISKIIAREDDLALALQAISLRIIAPIPGKSVIGFEVAHVDRTAVYFSALYEQSLKKFKGHLPLLLGQDTIGNTMVVDLLSMPHLLVAGSTGSGKSVALNTMLISLICYAKPEDLKLILFDPKKLEFATYDNLPHLLFPIVTAPDRAIAVLRWAVKTMNERYERMAKVGVRQAKEYHAIYHDMAPIVLVIDEFADLMITTGKEIEELIVRLAQMARAAGIHIILATQRPSVDVITGLIKVNFPARIAFKVTSKIDSRTIIDTSGADKLLGKGDMLFLDNQGMLAPCAWCLYY